MKFTKMHGIGNDYVYVDAFAEKLPTDVADLARRIADRRFGVGGDGLPIGVEFLARPFAEGLLFKAAFANEQATRHRHPPPLTPPLVQEP